MMNNMFTIPYYFNMINNWIETKKNILNKFNINDTENHSTYDHSINTDFYKFKNHQNDIEEIFHPYLIDFIRMNNFSKYTITQAWIEIANYSNNHNIHNHGATGFSAICYVNYDSLSHTPTFFISPFNNFTAGGTMLFANTKTKEGDFIIFPSVINHYTIPNLSNIPRIVLSFNFQVL